MWIVRIALDRPYTFIVLALLIRILSAVMILRTPTDIFPNINIPLTTALRACRFSNWAYRDRAFPSSSWMLLDRGRGSSDTLITNCSLTGNI
jgi:hypothetical protein